jgi:hypothetical protein
MDSKFYLEFLKVAVITRVPIQDFMQWLEEKLNEKYEINLEGLKMRFLKFYSIIKGILDYTVELNELVIFI